MKLSGKGAGMGSIPFIAPILLIALLFYVTFVFLFPQSGAAQEALAFQQLDPAEVSLRSGDRGDLVVHLQKALNYLKEQEVFGQNLPRPLVEDGVFGKLTLQTVLAYQNERKLVTDGWVGPQTALRIKRDLERAVKAQASPVAGDLYVVREGDTLFSIAARLKTSVAELVKANSLDNPDLIQPGLRLKLPTVGEGPDSDGGAPPQDLVSLQTPGDGPQDPSATQEPSADSVLGNSEASGSSPPNLTGSNPGINPGTLPSSPGSPSTSGTATDGGLVALTFNDGPDPVLTPKILDTLKARGVKATFFIVGSNAEKYQGVLLRIAQEGHEVENHSWRHLDFLSLSPTEQRNEILRTATIVRDVTGQSTRFFRPPFGAFDANLLKRVGDLNHRLVLWSNVGGTDLGATEAGDIVEGITRAAYNGAIIMLHDTVEPVAEALPRLIENLQRAGFRFVTLRELIDGPKDL